MQSPSLSELKKHLPLCLSRDKHALSNQLRRLHKQPDPERASLLAKKITASIAIAKQRKALCPAISFPDLPISQKRQEIAELISKHQVLILCGETGSGKTTQLPKICLELGRGFQGKIGHTQPRRLAAITVAQRIADEVQQPLGEAVGYKIRFQAKENKNTLVKLMTDGILLAEIKSDPFLSDYDTLILDEAHERSLNIDFLLGYMKWLLPRRADLKLIITSATIDPKRFSKHFNDAPVINVSGRTYPVEMRYQPLATETKDSPDSQSMKQAIVDAAAELLQERAGDILIFLSGEREIREATEALQKSHLKGCEVLPLFSRLSAKEQAVIFKPHQKTRIVLATNVAETSLTVPGIRCVIDTGLARISRYSHRSKLQRLPIEAISQASANQRSGRCGREAPGICIRLYDEDDFKQRALFTEPEILRTNLASVILQMKSLKLSDIHSFPFLEAPDEKMIRSGLRSLHELGALDDKEHLTAIGKRLGQFPLDPQLGRMLIAAEQLNCLSEALVIVSGLSIQDPRERPLDKAQAADQKHALFQHNRSDFLSFINIWNAYQENKAALSNNQLRKYCRQHFLAYMRLKDWEDIHQQLSQLFTSGKSKSANHTPLDSEKNYDNIHQALLSGLLARIGFKHELNEYLGARGVKFHIHPSSVLFKQKPKWIMASEQVETTRVYGRISAAIQATWIEKAAAHLIKQQYYEPHWEKNAGQAMIYQQVMLFGLTIAKGRKVPLSRVEPLPAREMFIRSGLVDRDIVCHADFYKHNLKLLETLEYEQQKGRRVDLLVDEEVLFEFYNKHLPNTISSSAGLNKWLKSKPEQSPLKLSLETITANGRSQVDTDKFPDSQIINGIPVILNYHFEPGHANDGVTATIPVDQLNQLPGDAFDWLVPGLLDNKILALIKSLPKPLRKLFVPAPNTAKDCLESLNFGQGQLLNNVCQFLTQLSGQKISAGDFNMALLEPHLLMNFTLVDDKKVLIASSRDFLSLKNQYASKANQSFQSNLSKAISQSGLKDWGFSDIPKQQAITTDNATLHTFPTLVDEEDSVGLTYVDSQTTADRMHKQGLIRLIRIKFAKEFKTLRKKSAISMANIMLYQGLSQHPYHPFEVGKDIFDDLEHQLVDSLFLNQDIRTEAEFEAALKEIDGSVYAHAYALSEQINKSLTAYKATLPSLEIWQNQPELADDIHQQINCLFYQGFVRYISAESLQRYPKYLKAIQVRLDKAFGKLKQDSQLAQSARAFENKFWAHVKDQPSNPEAESFRWMLEEFRVSLFAQQIKTPQPISEKRLQKAWQQLSS